jgi:UDP-4-amino-4,6-dideoxy-N-acetyl-beta-L-altrosamine N-acetyltransferase
VDAALLASLSDEERALPRDEVGWYQKYGIKYVDVHPPDLEELRRWRNHPDIQRFMVMRETITWEMQERWYYSFDRDQERYSMIVHDGRRVGLTQLRHIDAAAGTAEGGIIIFRPEDQNGLIPYRAAIGGMDWNFLERGLCEVRSTVLKSNSRARRFVRSLGYELSDPDPAGEVLIGAVTPARYFAAARKWRAVLAAEAGR